MAPSRLSNKGMLAKSVLNASFLEVNVLVLRTFCRSIADSTEISSKTASIFCNKFHKSISHIQIYEKLIINWSPPHPLTPGLACATDATTALFPVPHKKRISTIAWTNALQRTSSVTVIQLKEKYQVYIDVYPMECIILFYNTKQIWNHLVSPTNTCIGLLVE